MGIHLGFFSRKYNALSNKSRLDLTKSILSKHFPCRPLQTRKQSQSVSFLSTGTMCGEKAKLVFGSVFIPEQKVNIIPEWRRGEWVSESHLVMSDSLQSHGLYSPWNSPGQNTGVGSLSHLQGIFPTKGWNPGLPHCRRILYQLSHKGSPGEAV